MTGILVFLGIMKSFTPIFIFPFPVPSLSLPFFVSIVKILVSPYSSRESYLTLNVYFVLSRLALKFGWYDNKSRVAQEIKRTLMCSTLFCTFFCRCCRNVKLPSYTFYGENVVCVPKKILLLVFLFAFFFLPHSFSPCWALAFLIFFLLFFLSLLPFFSLSFASLSHTTFTFSLSLWVDMTINVAEYFKQPRYRNNFRFSLCLY